MPPTSEIVGGTLEFDMTRGRSESSPAGTHHGLCSPQAVVLGQSSLSLLSIVLLPGNTA